MYVDLCLHSLMEVIAVFLYVLIRMYYDTEQYRKDPKKKGYMNKDQIKMLIPTSYDRRGYPQAFEQKFVNLMLTKE